jgi:hypothetical protein
MNNGSYLLKTSSHLNQRVKAYLAIFPTEQSNQDLKGLSPIFIQKWIIL